MCTSQLSESFEHLRTCHRSPLRVSDLFNLKPTLQSGKLMTSQSCVSKMISACLQGLGRWTDRSDEANPKLKVPESLKPACSLFCTLQQPYGPEYSIYLGLEGSLL